MAQNLQQFAKNGRKIIGAALNYTELLSNPGVVKPENPVLFEKPTSTYITEGENIKLPKVFTKINQEAELGVIIGKKCKNVSVDEACSYIGGYCLALDLTAACNLAEARQKNLPWTLGKGFDTATPVSRFIDIKEIGNPECLRVWSKVNGITKQDGNTQNLLFSIGKLISYTSQYMTLEPSDLILTGTPAGACQINNGDVVTCGLGDFIEMQFNVTNE